MSGQDQRFYFRDLAVAAGDSCRDPHTFGFHLFERPPISIERCFQAREPLPSLDDNIDVLRIELQSVADALRQLRCGERRARCQEMDLEDQFAKLGADSESGAASTRRVFAWDDRASPHLSHP